MNSRLSCSMLVCQRGLCRLHFASTLTRADPISVGPARISYRSDLLRRPNTRHLQGPVLMSAVDTSAERDGDATLQVLPYLLTSQDKSFGIKYTASCMCGAVQYAVDCDPVAAKYCHCRSCQRLHGNAAASVISRSLLSYTAVKFGVMNCVHCCRRSFSVGRSFSQEVCPVREGC